LFKSDCQETTISTQKEFLVPKNGEYISFIPDLTTPDYFIEIKELKWFGGGTADQKIFGCPFNYFDLVNYTNKKLKIICVARQEELLFTDKKMAFFGKEAHILTKEYLSLCRKNGIEFYGLYDLLLKKQKNQSLF
jgi:hypothetical protein